MCEHPLLSSSSARASPLHPPPSPASLGGGGVAPRNMSLSRRRVQSRAIRARSTQTQRARRSFVRLSRGWRRVRRREGARDRGRARGGGGGSMGRQAESSGQAAGSAGSSSGQRPQVMRASPGPQRVTASRCVRPFPRGALARGAHMPRRARPAAPDTVAQRTTRLPTFVAYRAPPAAARHPKPLAFDKTLMKPTESHRWGTRGTLWPLYASALASTRFPNSHNRRLFPLAGGCCGATVALGDTAPSP